MSLLNAVVVAAAETKIQLVAPAWVFPLIAAIVFIVLGFIMWSFRDVANRHSHKVTAPSAHGTDHH